MITKVIDKDFKNSLLIISTVLRLYEEDDKLITFDCPICGNQANASLIIHGDSQNGVIECKSCDTFIRI